MQVLRLNSEVAVILGDSAAEILISRAIHPNRAGFTHQIRYEFTIRRLNSPLPSICHTLEQTKTEYRHNLVGRRQQQRLNWGR